MSILDSILPDILYGEDREARKKLSELNLTETWEKSLYNIYNLFVERKLDKCKDLLDTSLNEKIKNSDTRNKLFCIKQILKSAIEFLEKNTKTGQNCLDEICDKSEYSDLIEKLRKHQRIPLIRETVKASSQEKGELVKQCQEKEEFVRLYRECSEITSVSNWYVVEANWFALWMKKVSLIRGKKYLDLPFIHLETTSQEKPGKIINFPILESQSKDELDLNNKYKKPLKTGLHEFTDYILLPEKPYKYLNSKYGSDEEVLRPSIETKNGSYSIEVFLKKIEVVFVSKKKLVKKHHLTSRFEKLKNILQLVYKQLHENFTNIYQKQTKIWKVDSETMTQNNLEKLIKSQNDLYFEGCQLLDTEKSIEESEISNTDYFFFDISIPQNSFVINNSSANCSKCKTQNKVLDCKCRNPFCEKCINKHRSHNNSCNPSQKRRFSLFSCFSRKSNRHSSEANLIKSQAKHPKVIQDSSEIKAAQEVYANKKAAQELEETASTTPTSTNLGISLHPVGLQNLGNTCFMNSALQCLAYCEPLTAFFLSADLKSKINKTNPLGTKGKLAIVYSDLLRQISEGKAKSFAPWDLKKTISSFASQFEGYQQQDSHEFLSYLISGLHEDLNEIKQKPYEGSEIKYINDEITATESWNRFSARNKSFIVDLMYGQYKSTVVCPRCRKESITFDPFSSISLPIPANAGKTYEVNLVKYNWSEGLAKVTVSATHKTEVLEINKQLETRLNIEQVKTFEMKSRIAFKEIEDSEKFTKPKDGLIWFYEVPPGSQYFCFVLISVEGTKEEYPCRILEIDPKTTSEDLHQRLDETAKKSFTELLGEKMKINPKIVSFSNYFIDCFVCGANKCEKLCDIKTSKKSVQAYLAKNKYIYVKVLIPQPPRTSKVSSLKDFKVIKGSSGASSIADCFSAFGLPETLDEKNSWYCPTCKKHVQATKKMEIFKVPQILIIHLKRFKATGFFKEKINTAISFPSEDLDIRDFVQKSPGPYDLFAVSNHFGTLSGGHYTATVFNSGRSAWYDCNDSSVSEASGVSDTASYVLFYKAKSSRKISNSV